MNTTKEYRIVKTTNMQDVAFHVAQARYITDGVAGLWFEINAVPGSQSPQFSIERAQEAIEVDRAKAVKSVEYIPIA